MANHASAKKRARQDLKRRARNRHIRGLLKTAIKRARTAVDSGDADAGETVRKAEREIRRAATKGVLSKKQASRKVSRLARSLHAATS